MDISIRHAVREDFAEIAQVDQASFGEEMSPARVEDYFLIVDPDRFLVACDGPRIVGIAGDYLFSMTVPGGELPVAGVTWVSVDVTHRRRGVLTALMRQQLTECREQGLPMAVLNASESGIYGRFGYGAATQVRKTEIHRRRVQLRTPGDAGAVRRLNAVEARFVLPALHERWRTQSSGAVSRNDGFWDFILADKDWQRAGMSPTFHLVHDGGYVSYRIKTEWTDGDPRHLCWITDYAVATHEAHRDLWQVLLGLDLVGSIESYHIPIDDPLPYLLDDARQVRTTHVADGVWARLLDIPAVLAARRYGVDIDVVLDVADAMFGDVRVRLQGGPDGASCEITDGPADVRLDVSTLGAISLGGNRLDPLAAAGRIDAAPGVLRRLDRAFLADRAPSVGTGF